MTANHHVLEKVGSKYKDITLATRMAEQQQPSRGITFGFMLEFDKDQKSIATNIERVKLFFVANNVEDAKEAAVFLSIVGVKRYGLYTSLYICTSARKTLEEITEP